MPDAGKNFRQAGVAITGRVMNGSAGVNATDPELVVKPKRKPPTIPAKFETQLFFSNKERDGFNNRTFRFNTSDTIENPGPGAYAQPSDSCVFIKTTDSISKRGYGGFASKSKRFPGRQGKVGGAAPGGYEIPDFITEANRRVFNKSNTSSFKTAFAKTVPVEDDERVNPGPGTYEVPEVRSAPSSGVGGTSVFKSKEDRFGPKFAGGPIHNPAPGDYEDQSRHMVASKAVTSSFRDGQLRFTTEMEEKHIRRTEELQNLLVKHRHTSIPPKRHAQRQFKGTFAVKPETDITNPGPGEYESTKKISYSKTEDKESSMFALNGLDRFGRPILMKKVKPILPGPGAYEAYAPLDNQREERLPVSSSSFMSLSERMAARALRKGKPPGPAFYNPEGLGKKSFHLNSNKRWL